MQLIYSVLVLVVLGMIAGMDAGRPNSGPCKHTTPYLTPGGMQQYCGRGGSRCPAGTYCDIAPNDAYATCCNERRPVSGPCRGTASYLVDGKLQNCGRGGKRCPSGTYCDIAANDAYAQCCHNKVGQQDEDE